MHCPMWCCRSGPIFGLTGSTPVSAIHAYTSTQITHSILKSIKLECERAPQGRASISSRPSRESENQPSSIEHRKKFPQHRHIPIESSIIDLGIQSEIASECLPIALSFAERLILSQQNWASSIAW